MRVWVARLALVVLSLLATGCAGATMLAAGAAETSVKDLLVTCLACGEQWLFTPTATFGAGLMSLLRRRTVTDKCPKCGSRAVAFGHAEDPTKRIQGRTA